MTVSPRSTVTVDSAGTSDTFVNNVDGSTEKAQLGTFVFVTFSKFDDRYLDPDQMLEVKGSDGLLYDSTLATGPDLGGAPANGHDGPNHFTEGFDLPKNAAKGAVLIVHANGIDRDADGSHSPGREPPPGYDNGAYAVDLGL